MPERPFQIGGATVPPLVGRKAIVERVISALSKRTPDHLQIVGPRLSGKTILMAFLAEHMRSAGSPYKAVIQWDLAHNTPRSNEEFLLAVRDWLASAVSGIKKDYTDHLRSVQTNPFSDICEVVDLLRMDEVSILLLCDGFDKPIGNGNLTRNLWDQLRELASRPNVRFVTATRRPLHELIRSEDTQTSDFWGIFDPSPVRVGCMDDDDVDEALSALTGIKFETGARTELSNWTGGFPPLLLSVLNAIALKRTGTIDAAEVNHIAESLGDDVAATLTTLWSDCPESSKDLFKELVAAKGVNGVKVNHSELSPLLERGFAKKVGSKVVSACRLLERYIGGAPEEMGSMRRLFGSPAQFEANARPFLERRLDSLENVDSLLKRYLNRAIEDIPDHPDVCLRSIRGIVDRALELIWAAEFAGKKVPPQYIADWQSKGESRVESDWANKVPSSRGHQVRLLQLLTGTQNCSAKGKFVTRTTYVLLDVAQSFADFGQHLEETLVSVSMAFTAMITCLELADCLSQQLATTSQTFKSLLSSSEDSRFEY